MTTDLAYRAGDGLDAYAQERCRLDVYHPKGAPGFATVVWFHGGGLTTGERFLPDALREKGVAVVTVNYRLSPTVKVRDCIADAAAAVAWTFQNIENFDGDPDRIFVSGHSAGGYLASMVGLDKSYLAEHDIDANRIAGLIPLSGHTITHFTARGEQGVPGTQAVVDALAPIYHVRNDSPPMLLITGDRDLELLGRYEENAYFWRMAQVVEHPDTEIFELEGCDHGQMMPPSFPLLLRFIERISNEPAEAKTPG
ncbi:MAG: alpha/beta hydrolase [Planctomycetota bacterium]